MSPLWTAWAIVGGFAGVAVAAYVVLSRAIDHRPRSQDACLDPVLILAVAHAEDATEWIVCDSPDCRLLSTPHRRDTSETATCLWCSRVALVPAPAAPKEG